MVDLCASDAIKLSPLKRYNLDYECLMLKTFAIPYNLFHSLYSTWSPKKGEIKSKRYECSILIILFYCCQVMAVVNAAAES